MSIEIGDVFWNEKERASYLVIDTDNPWDEGIEYKFLRFHCDEDCISYYALTWIPKSILLSQNGQSYVKIGHIDISLFMDQKERRN